MDIFLFFLSSIEQPESRIVLIITILSIVTESSCHMHGHSHHSLFKTGNKPFLVYRNYGIFINLSDKFYIVYVTYGS